MKKKQIQILLVFAATLTCLSLGITRDARGNENNQTSNLINSTSEKHLIVRSIYLTGRWRGNDGGIYYIRQVGNDIFWFVESSDSTSWTNVYHGYISGRKIIGSWADVPKGNIRQAGEMDLIIESPRRMVAIRKTGGFGGSVWTR